MQQLEQQERQGQKQQKLIHHQQSLRQRNYVYTPIFAPFILYEQVSVKTPTHRDARIRTETEKANRLSRTTDLMLIGTAKPALIS